MKQNLQEKTPQIETREEKITRLEEALRQLNEQEEQLLQMLEDIKTSESTPEKEKSLTDRLRQAGKTALVTAALTFGSGNLTDTEKVKETAPEPNSAPVKTEAVETTKGKEGNKDTVSTILYTPEKIEKIKEEPIINAEEIIAERIENDPSIHERAQDFIKRMDASLLNKLSTSAQIIYLSFIEENIKLLNAKLKTRIHFIVDKDETKLYVIDSANRLLAETPVILGQSLGNGLNTSTLKIENIERMFNEKEVGKYTTPAGLWEISNENPDPAYGVNQRRVLVGEPEQEQNIMIHPPLKGLPPEKADQQRSAYFSKNPLDRRLSEGCIRAPVWFLNEYIKLFDNGATIAISPEKEGDAEIFIDPSTAEMHKIGSKEWAENDYAAILRDIQKVQKERREALKNLKK